MRRNARIECKGFLARHNGAFAKKKGDAKELFDSNTIGTWKFRPTGLEVVDPAHSRVYLEVRPLLVYRPS